MNRIISNIIVLAGLAAVLISYYLVANNDSDYWYFLTNHMAMNITLAIISVVIGFLVKNYSYIFAGASFVLGIYCLTFIFQSGSFDMKLFFLAIYTNFLGFSVLANLCRHFKDWMFPAEIYSS
jgi:hypothetical protein